MQEVALSTRTLFFAKDYYSYRCGQLQAAEDQELHYGETVDKRFGKDKTRRLMAHGDISLSNFEKLPGTVQMRQGWVTMVGQYSKRAFSEPTDRLTAFRPW